MNREPKDCQTQRFCSAHIIMHSSTKVKEQHKPTGGNPAHLYAGMFHCQNSSRHGDEFCIRGLILPCKFEQSSGAYMWVQGILQKINVNYLHHVITKTQTGKIPLSMGLQPSQHLSCCLAWFHVFL